MNTLSFKRVYVKEAATTSGPLEAPGPLAGSFDKTHDDIYCGENSYEAAERRLVQDAVEILLKKCQIKHQEIDLAIGGDLLNQLGTAHYFMKSLISLLPKKRIIIQIKSRVI